MKECIECFGTAKTKPALAFEPSFAIAKDRRPNARTIACTLNNSVVIRWYYNSVPSTRIVCKVERVDLDPTVVSASCYDRLKREEIVMLLFSEEWMIDEWMCCSSYDTSHSTSTTYPITLSRRVMKVSLSVALVKISAC